MKISSIKFSSLIVIFLTVCLLSACDEKAPEPEEKQEQEAVKKVKPSIDTTQKKVIYKKPEPKKPEPKIYIVKSGEWLWDIARKEYGTPIGWFRIYEANRAKIRNPELIYPGQQFVIPEFKRRK